MEFLYFNKFLNLQISTLGVLSSEDMPPLNEDAECAARQIVRHVCVAMKRYMECHLQIKAEQLQRTQFRPNERSPIRIPPTYKVNI